MVFASQALTVPKASLDVSLLRPDPASVSREDVAELHRLLYAVITECSPRNVQTCRAWLSHNILRSQGRLTALGKYLVALSKSFESGHVDRQRVHLVFVIHDLLHYSKFHSDADHLAVGAALHPHIQALLGAAYAGDRARSSKHFARLDDLLNLWVEQEIFSAEDNQTLKDIASGATQYTSTSNDSDTLQTSKPTTDPPYILPPTHGDRSTPYYDLPAGNMIPHIQPNSTAPLNPTFIRPIQLPAGPADPTLVDAVRSFLREVDGETDTLEQGEKANPPLIDALGQTLVRDEVTGELAPTETYYGWSVAFCERMRNSGRDREQSRGRGRSGSSTPRERQRYSSSRSRSRTRRSSSRSRDHQARQWRRRSATRSRSRSRSPMPRRQRSPSYSPPAAHQPRAGFDRYDRHSFSQGLSGPPPPPPPHHQAPASQYFNGPPPSFAVPPPPPPPSQAGQPWQGQFPPPHPSLMLGPNGMPLPPPPPEPANYQGPWPPPPPGMPALFPPPPHSSGHGGQNQWQGGADPRRH